MNTGKLHSAESAEAASLFSPLDRNQAKLLSDYLPEAPGVAIAGDALLRAIGYLPGSKRPPDWVKTNSGVFRSLRRLNTPMCSKYAVFPDRMILQVRQCGKLWVIERFLDGDWLDPAGRPGLNICALVCTQTNRPIWGPTYQAAMRLASHCHPTPRSPVVGRWSQVYKKEHAEFVAEYERNRAAWRS